MADKPKMSVAEMLAAARAEKSGGKPAAPTSAADSAAVASPPISDVPVTEPTAAEPAAAEVAATKPAVKPAKGLSVAEMLAAARKEKSAAPAAAAPAKPVATAPKPAAPVAQNPVAAAAPKAAAAATATIDTASILAAARTGSKPGPVSKTELAKQSDSKPSAKAKHVVPPMPEKPVYARPVARTEVDASRRGFVAGLAAALVIVFQSSLAVGFGSLAVTSLLWVLGLARYMFPNVLIEPPTKFKVGFPDDFAPGQVQTKFIPQFGVWIVRYEYEGQPMIYALKSVCTHLGCTPNWLEGEQKFKCPCHGSGFYKDGVNFEGPAPRPLERYAISKADDGQLQVDKSRTFQQEVGGWKDPTSFVPV